MRGAGNMTTLHIYRKSIIKDNYYTDKRPMPVFVDDYHVCDMKPGDYTAVSVTPVPHKIVVKVPVLVSNTLTKEITVDGSSTDVYFAFRGRMGKYISPKIFEPAQYNMAEFSGVPGTMAKVALRSEDMALKPFIWYTVTINGHPAGTMDGDHLEFAFTIPKGKHRVAFESQFEIGYAVLDIREDSTYVLVNDCKIIYVLTPPVNPANPARQIKCVFTRKSRVEGCACSTKITIDTVQTLKLKNGETKAVFISEGRHVLVLRANKIEAREFTVPDNCSEIDILIDNMDDIVSITAKA